MRLLIALFVLIFGFATFVNATKSCTTDDDCGDQINDRHCCADKTCGNCVVPCSYRVKCTKSGDVCCFERGQARGRCLKNPPPGQPCTVSIPTKSSATLPPFTSPRPLLTSPQPSSSVGMSSSRQSTFAGSLQSTTPYENRCFRSDQCQLAGYRCCWDVDRVFGHCVPPDQTPADCESRTQTDPPGGQRCFDSAQCARMHEPANCCPTKNEWGVCKSSCTGPTESRCFVDEQCGKADSVCCWQPRRIHGDCYERQSLPQTCEKVSPTPSTGVYPCYNDAQCTFYHLPSPQTCCNALGELPGQCAATCSGLTTPTPVDPRCFVDEMCGDRTKLCCWTEGVVHGECTSRTSAPSTCKTRAHPTPAPTITYCFNSQQCQLAGAEPTCCGAKDETPGQCAATCSAMAPPTTVDPRCFTDSMCGDPTQICCWNKHGVYGDCVAKDGAPKDCFDPHPTPPGGATMCFTSQQCKLAGAGDECCHPSEQIPGFCEPKCPGVATNTTVDPRCFLDEMCGDPKQICCWTKQKTHGDCVPASGQPKNCRTSHVTPLPGSTFCYTSQQCQLVNAGSTCCGPNGETPGLCADNCTAVATGSPASVDPRCFSDAMCGDSTQLCCWNKHGVHGDCVPKDGAPKDCFDPHPTPPGGETFCYTPQQCQLVKAGEKCCHAIGEIPGFCGSECLAGSNSSTTVDPRCFTDVMCGSSNQLCCWSKHEIHGECVSKNGAPSGCVGPHSTPPTGVTRCYTSQQCELAGTGPNCCGSIRDQPGICASNCSQGDFCFQDRACDSPNQKCCWQSGHPWGNCMLAGLETTDCETGKTTDPPSAVRCFSGLQCERMGQPSTCCKQTDEQWGVCRSSCSTSTRPHEPSSVTLRSSPQLTTTTGSSVPSATSTAHSATTSSPLKERNRCFVDRHCEVVDDPGTCCLDPDRGYGFCTPKNADGTSKCTSSVKIEKPKQKLQSRLSLRDSKEPPTSDSTQRKPACSLDAQCTMLPEKFEKCCLKDGQTIGFCC